MSLSLVSDRRRSHKFVLITLYNNLSLKHIVRFQVTFRILMNNSIRRYEYQNKVRERTAFKQPNITSARALHTPLEVLYNSHMSQGTCNRICSTQSDPHCITNIVK